jgi:hypothetical protein
LADTTPDTPAPARNNKMPSGDANPNSKAARLIRNAEFEEHRAKPGTSVLREIEDA